ncbi:MAG: hypothetical protein Q4C25_07580 [Bacillota bacterium]|nr:hypothetical protein [Bacillota bacterium]
MNNVILCEGVYDLRILGYYLHKSTSGKWMRASDAEKPALFRKIKIPREYQERTELYTACDNEDKITALWPAGGKSNFQQAIHDICHINSRYPKQRFERIVLLVDRDDNQICEELRAFENCFAENGWAVSQLVNSRETLYSYPVEDGTENTYDVRILPMVIPFYKNGAMETVLLDAIAHDNEEDGIVVREAERFIQRLQTDDKIIRYLKHSGDVIKAKYSATISVINPDHGSSEYDRVLLCANWEEKGIFNEHFGVLKDFL